MLSIDILPQQEYRWEGENPAPEVFPREKNVYPLYHQWRTYLAENSLVINTHNTGTGKTKATLLRLLKRVRNKGNTPLYPTNDNVLFIAPTNALIAQHVQDIRTFCQACEELAPYRVEAITKEDIERCQNDTDLRRAFRLHQVLNDGSLLDGDTQPEATIYVTNPDIFYYALYCCYNRFDRALLFRNFIKYFNYVVIDEFHYYNAKQLAAFLFFLKLSLYEGYFESAYTQRQVCILTATPHPTVEAYLQGLKLPIDWIRPGEIATEDQPFVSPVTALAPVHLQVYNTEKLQSQDRPGGLLELLEHTQQTVREWLETEKDGYRMEGAMISHSLGTINRLHARLQHLLSPDMMRQVGRITGPQKAANRAEAKDCALILATPTVDIGYNFERSEENKVRQNLDFLLFEASSSDEFLQRLGRAARVLAKPQKHHQSVVYAVVSPACYNCLKGAHGQQLERARLTEIAQEMPRQNDLYAYLRTGAIIDLFRSLSLLARGVEDEAKAEVEDFLHDMERYFAGTQEPPKRSLTLKTMQGYAQTFEAQQQAYGPLHTMPPETWTVTRQWLRTRKEPEKESEAYHSWQSLKKRLINEQQRGLKEGPLQKRTPDEILRWFYKDVCEYRINQVRFSFREGFQPPLALAYDPERRHSSNQVALYDMMHFLTYYHVQPYSDLHEWEEKTGMTYDERELDDVHVYLRLGEFREQPLHLGFQLDASQYAQHEWEEHFAYQMAALYGLDLISLNEQGVFTKEVMEILASCFVPAFVVLHETTSITQRELFRLRSRVRVRTFPLHITFSDGKVQAYTAILGFQALLVCAELPFWALRTDLRKALLKDDHPIIC